MAARGTAVDLAAQTLPGAGSSFSGVRMIARLLSTLALLLVLLAPHAAAAQDVGQGSGAAGRVRAVADSVARAALERDVMAGMVVFAQRGRDTLILRAYGRAEVENSVPMSVDHVFQFASITKQFTAAAVLRLVQDGRVALDAPITNYLPAAPVRGRTITVRQLLAHTSGLPDYAESPRVGTIKRLDLPPDSLVALVMATPFYFEPGDFLRYSNTGFALLGQLIEKLSGKAYAAYVEEEVLRPSGARSAHFCNPRALVRHLARGYVATPSGLRPADFVSPYAPWAAGGFCGTVHDLAAWNAELHERRGGRILSQEMYREMVRPATIRGGRVARYGLGVALSEVAGRRAVQHGGDIDGFTTFTAYLPDDSLNVTVLINTQGPTRPDAVAGLLVEAALGTTRPANTAAPKNLAMFAGKYGGDVEITEVADGAPALRMKRGPMPPMVLRYVGRSNAEWVFTDGRSYFAFEAPPASGAQSPAIWADLGVALVRWERDR
jgi:CubicO group peptidase (beta-lactamase class C family)